MQGPFSGGLNWLGEVVDNASNTVQIVDNDDDSDEDASIYEDEWPDNSFTRPARPKYDEYALQVSQTIPRSSWGYATHAARFGGAACGRHGYRRCG